MRLCIHCAHFLRDTLECDKSEVIDLVFGLKSKLLASTCRTQWGGCGEEGRHWTIVPVPPGETPF